MASAPSASGAPLATGLASRTAGTAEYSAEIRRTEYGVPHILAHDYGGLGYGYGYAFAQDNLCTIANRVVTLRGQRSSFFGPTGDSGDTLGASTDNLDSDVYYQSLRDSGTIKRLLARPAPLGPTAQARRLVDGYVAGYNRYLHDTGVANLPDPTCRGKSWVTPITAEDVWTNVYDLDTLTGVAMYKQFIATASPPTAGSGSTAAQSAAALPVTLGTTGPSSNGWALGRDATVNHDGMVLANPHVPWTGNARLYQVQFTIPGVLNVSGASLYGTPMLEFGHTSGVAWTLTASHATRFTLYQLHLASGDPTSYVVDGHVQAMSKQNVTVSVRDASGQLSTVTRTLYSSVYGPVLGSGWTTSTALAIRDAGADNVRSVDELLAMGRSQSVAQLRATQDTYQGLPWTYTLAADTGGTVYFADASVAPHVTDAEEQRCEVGHIGGDNSIPILDGSTSSCGWGSDPDAIEPGIFGPSNYPHLVRTDYVANSNNSPMLANPAAPLTGYAPVYDSRAQLELRPRLSLNMISERVAGTDGYGPAGFTLNSLQETMFGQRNYSADLARTAVVAMCRAHPVLTASDGHQINVSAACSVLAAWNGRADVNSRGEVLWQEAYGQLNYTPDWWRVPFDPAQPLTTPRDLNTESPAVQAALADAVETFQADNVPLDIPLGAIQHYAGISLPGCTEGEGCFDRVEGNALPASGGGGKGKGAAASGSAASPDASNGSTFIMATEMTPSGPRTRTIITYSESANPDSPHYSDQTALFARGQMITERFTEAQIAADPGLQTTTLTS
ncbi:MAG: penicillin acylase family protein [Streptosporangiaceae bacterium]|nr:penicillin acylase family protein [Streptosporangiaceae bacterium]